MTSTTKLVQFMHPGYEHGPDTPGQKAWNTRDHRRKFLHAPGRFRIDQDTADQSGDLLFWGEWEAQSEVAELERTGVNTPRWLHTPRLRTLASYRGAQNTDPFVFNDRFLYTCCKQRLRSGRPTQLRFLEDGSVILFGSHVRGGFALDTVFVVDDHVDHQVPGDVPPDVVPEAYVHTTVLPMYEMDADYCDPQQIGWRLYQGASPSRPRAGMFSFVPARPVADDSPQGFARPEIALDRLITPSLRQGQKITALPPDEVQAAWQHVVEQVLDHDLVLATAFETPRIDAAEPSHDRSERTRC
jgi:hypothetical protein